MPTSFGADVILRYRRTLSNDRQHLLEGYRFIELARKVVGVGSVGTRSWVLLFLGRDSSDPLFLQAKEAEESVLERFAGSSEYRNHGERVVSGQRLMQAASDIFLGWERMRGLDGKEHHYYVRRLRDWKWSVDVGGKPVSTIKIWGRLCAWTLARAHAARATASPSLPIWARATPSIAQWPRSRRPTQSRTSATTPCLERQ